MKKRLEDYVKRNREAFDTEVPGERVWKRIESKLRKKPDGELWMWKAAAIIFFGLSVFLLGRDFMNGKPGEESSAEIANAKNEFLEAENYYTGLISLKEEELDSYSAGNDFDYKAQVGNLNAIYQVLKTELEKDPSQEIVDALILNLISRMDILNRELERLSNQEAEEPKAERGSARS